MHIAIIGSGSAAFAAAIYAAERGVRVIMIEKGTTGGTCVNVGCVPSKIFIRAAHIAHTQQAHAFQGIVRQAPSIQRKLLLEQQQRRVDELRYAKYENILKANPNITFMQGEAYIEDKQTLVVKLTEDKTERVVVDRILIATGSSPYIPKIPGLKDTPYWTSTEALQSETLPKHLIVLGGSFVAVELAQGFARLGTKVTLLTRSTLLSKEDPQIGEGLKAIFEEEGIRVLLHTVPQEISHDSQQFSVNTGKEIIVSDQLLIATGRWANTQPLNLEKIGVQTTQEGSIIVDDHMRTNIDTIYAAGDCTTQPQYVYVAAAAGTRAAVNMLGGNVALDLSIVPAVTFSDPQVATVGLTETQAKQLVLEVESRTLQLDSVPRALVNFDTRGFIKLVAEKNSGKIIGAHILAAEGGETIQTAAVAIRVGMTIDQLATQLFPYLTMVEGLKLCAQIFKKDVKKLSCCADSIVLEAEQIDAQEKMQQETKPITQMETALQAISKLLPLKKRQQELDPQVLTMHRHILHSFAENGRPLTRTEMAELLIQDNVTIALAKLYKKDLVVLNKEGEITGAYPFTLNPTPHVLTIGKHKVFAMCAFDAVGVSAMFKVEVVIQSHCGLTKTPLQIRIFNHQVLDTSHPELRVGIYWQEPGACAEKTLCTELVFLKDMVAAQQWALQKENALLLTLTEAIELSSAFFIPLITESEEKIERKEKSHIIQSPTISEHGLPFWQKTVISLPMQLPHISQEHKEEDDDVCCKGKNYLDKSKL